MKEISRHILSIIILIGCILGMESCINDNASDCDGTTTGTQDKDQLRLVLHISSLDAGDPQSPDVTEKIKSLRVIILNEKNNKICLECNKKVIDSETTFNANQFQHIFTWSTIEGIKHFYLFANEESVQSVKTSEEGEPNSLSDLLDSYTPDTTKATDFAEVIKSVYFEPKSAYDISDNSIYLPYTAYYYGYEMKIGEYLSENMYLVPVATKFTFNFINKRANPVSVGKIALSTIDTHNYLFANIDEEDQFKTFGDEDETELYWIDWLAKIAEESHKYGDFDKNENFNNKYGWISTYKIPGETVPYQAQLISDNNKPSVPAKTDDTTPGILQLGPFYLPESKGEEKDGNGIEKEITEFRYFLTLGLTDEETSTFPIFEDTPISNLKSLFRNTSVIINITMSEGDVEVYAEIADWNERSVNGWVTEGPQLSNAHKQ